jgi:hypothetical protein
MNSLEQSKSVGIKKLIISYKNWLDHFRLYLENSAIQLKNPDTIEIMTWVESFRTSSEKIGKILQSIRHLHQEIIFHTKLSKTTTNFKTIEVSNEYYLKLISSLVNQMPRYLEDCDMYQDEVQVVTFKLEKEEFGIFISDVR